MYDRLMGSQDQGRRVASSATTFYECPSCGYLSADPLLVDAGHPCPSCGSSSVPRRTFPTERLLRLDDRVRRYYREGEHEIVVILVAAFLEAILEDMLDRLLTAHGADVAVREVVLDAQRAIGGRIGRVFPRLTGVQFEEAASELGYRDFPHRWREMRGARNAFIHDSPFTSPRESLDGSMASEAMRLLDQSYRLFVLINNRFVVDGRLGRVHVAVPLAEGAPADDEMSERPESA